MAFTVRVTLIIAGRAIIAYKPDNLASALPGVLRRWPSLDPFILGRDFMTRAAAVQSKGDRGQCAVGQAGFEERAVPRPLLEKPRLVFDDLIGNAMIVHPLAEDRDKSARVRLLGHGCQQRHLRDFAAADELDDHRGRIGARAPCRNDGPTKARAHATIASQRSGQAGGRIVTLNACSGATPCTT